MVACVYWEGVPYILVGELHQERSDLGARVRYVQILDDENVGCVDFHIGAHGSGVCNRSFDSRLSAEVVAGREGFTREACKGQMRFRQRGDFDNVAGIGCDIGRQEATALIGAGQEVADARIVLRCRHVPPCFWAEALVEGGGEAIDARAERREVGD